MLSVSTKQGSLHSYLMKVPCLCAGWDTKVAFLASLRATELAARAAFRHVATFAPTLTRSPTASSEKHTMQVESRSSSLSRSASST